MERWFSEKTGNSLDILQTQQRLIVLGLKFRVIAFVEVLLNKNNEMIAVLMKRQRGTCGELVNDHATTSDVQGKQLPRSSSSLFLTTTRQPITIPQIPCKFISKVTSFVCYLCMVLFYSKHDILFYRNPISFSSKNADVNMLSCYPPLIFAIPNSHVFSFFAGLEPVFTGILDPGMPKNKDWMKNNVKRFYLRVFCDGFAHSQR